MQGRRAINTELIWKGYITDYYSKAGERVGKDYHLSL